MRIYWYWPFPHAQQLPLARAVTRPGDELVVHCLDTGGQSPDGSEPYELRRGLPAPDSRREGSARWMASRAGTYVRRSRRRAVETTGAGFDICHIHGLNYFTDGIALPRLARHTKVVSTVHDVVPHQARLPASLERPLLRRLYRNAGTLIVLHDRIGDELITRFGVDPERIRVVPLVFRDPVAAPRTVQPNEVPVVLFFGAFRRDKGIPTLLEAIRSIELTDVRFHFAGTGIPELEGLVRQAAAGDARITAEIGRVSNERRADLYRSASLVVMPYTAMGSQSGILRDASAYRVPVVVSDLGVSARTVERGRAGWVVPPGDAGALAAAMTTALLDPHERVRAGNALGEVPDFATFDEVGQLLRGIYDEVRH